MEVLFCWQLNIYTTLLYFAGNCVRIYTTRTQLQGDRISLLKSAASALGNFTMMVQVVASPRLASPRDKLLLATSLSSSQQLLSSRCAWYLKGHAGGAVAVPRAVSSISEFYWVQHQS